MLFYWRAYPELLSRTRTGNCPPQVISLRMCYASKPQSYNYEGVAMASCLNIFSPSVIGADVHKKSIVCCARYLEDNTWYTATATFGTVKDEILRMASW